MRTPPHADSFYFVPQAESVESLPKWNFDGSSTGQAPGDDSEVILRPCRIFKDPFRPNGKNILVMCDCYTPQGEPIESNTRAIAMKAFAGHEDEEPWFGLEQEFTLFNLDQKTPLGWPVGGMPSRPQGPYYCSAGPENNFGRAITDAMYKACLYAGIAISGVNGEVMPGQQEYRKCGLLCLMFLNTKGDENFLIVFVCNNLFLLLWLSTRRGWTLCGH
jgi:glutamine synthetase